ncbi:hydrophobin 2 [Hysterangium stoloniferum]|nr:hydrophobin 2 [Hysterangium stoloniferum]
MVFTSNVFLVLSSLTLLAVASHHHPKPTVTITVSGTAPTATTISQCNTVGSPQCCNTVGSATSPSVANQLGLLGIAVQALNGVNIGLGCTPITVIGLGQGADCSQHPVCCTNVKQDGLVNVGCTPITL